MCTEHNGQSWAAHRAACVQGKLTFRNMRSAVTELRDEHKLVFLQFVRYGAPDIQNSFRSEYRKFLCSATHRFIDSQLDYL